MRLHSALGLLCKRIGSSWIWWQFRSLLLLRISSKGWGVPAIVRIAIFMEISTPLRRCGSLCPRLSPTSSISCTGSGSRRRPDASTAWTTCAGYSRILRLWPPPILRFSRAHYWWRWSRWRGDAASTRGACPYRSLEKSQGPAKLTALKGRGRWPLWRCRWGERWGYAGPSAKRRAKGEGRGRDPKSSVTVSRPTVQPLARYCWS